MSEVFEGNTIGGNRANPKRMHNRATMPNAITKEAIAELETQKGNFGLSDATMNQLADLEGFDVSEIDDDVFDEGQAEMAKAALRQVLFPDALKSSETRQKNLKQAGEILLAHFRRRKDRRFLVRAAELAKSKGLKIKTVIAAPAKKTKKQKQTRANRKWAPTIKGYDDQVLERCDSLMKWYACVCVLCV